KALAQCPPPGFTSFPGCDQTSQPVSFPKSLADVNSTIHRSRPMPSILHRNASRRLYYRFLAVVAVVLTLSTTQLSQAQYTWRNVQIYGGGFVTGIIFNASEPNLVYARTDIGGAYRLDPATNRWVSLLDSISWDDWNLTGVISLATDSVNPNNVYIAAGTYTNDWTTQNGAILRSSDRGATWQRTMLPFKLGGNMPGRGAGERLVIDPNRNSVLFLGAPSGNGLWKSTDSGVTWSKVTSFPNPGNYVQDPADPN